MRIAVPKALTRQIIIKQGAKCYLCQVQGVPISRFNKWRVVIPDEYYPVEPWQKWNGKVKLTFHIDHIKPVCVGGTNDPDNLRLACPTCNGKNHYLRYMVEHGILEV